MRRKLLSVLLVGILAASMLMGCSSKKEDNSGEAKITEAAAEATSTTAPKEQPYHATLMYFVGSDAKDQNSVNEAINALAKEQLSMTIDLLPVTIGTYMQQIQLTLSGGEPLDVFPIFASSASTYIQSQYVVDLSKMIDEKGKDIIAAVGKDDVWCSSVGDFLWGVTTMRERVNPCGLVVRTDILNETGMKAEDIKTLEDVTALYTKVRELYPEMTCFGGANGMAIPSIANTYDTLGDTFGVLENHGQTTTVTNWYASEEFKSYVKVMRDWYVNGYSSQDFPTSTDSGEFLMKAGNLFSFATWYKPNSKMEKDAATGFDTTIIPITESLLSTSSTGGVSYGIASNSENPEKAMELLNWLYSNADVNNLLNWGVEGKDWVLQEDGTINYPEGVTADSVGYHEDFGWALPNQFIARVWKGNDPDVFKTYQAVRDNAIMSKAYGFSFDNKEVLNEISAVTAVSDRYKNSICTGSVDPDTSIDEFNKALYDAGLQKIIDAKQKQLDTWLAAK